MTTTSRPRHTRALGVSWLALGLPVGALLGWLLQISDNAQDRRYGGFLLALAVLSLVLGLILVHRSRRGLWAVSLGASGLWAIAFGLALTLADFPSDRLWGGGLTGLVAVVTGSLALARQPRS